MHDDCMKVKLHDNKILIYVLINWHQPLLVKKWFFALDQVFVLSVSGVRSFAVSRCFSPKAIFISDISAKNNQQFWTAFNVQFGLTVPIWFRCKHLINDVPGWFPKHSFCSFVQNLNPPEFVALELYDGTDSK